MQRTLILLVFLFAHSAGAQISSRFFVDGELVSDRVFADSVRLSNHLRKTQLDWLNDGYFFSGIDSVEKDSVQTNIYFHKGEKFSSDIEGLEGKRLRQRLEKKLSEYANHGYPFASLQLDSLSLENQDLAGALMINPGPEIRYDSASFFQKPKTNSSYIFQLLDIVPGTAFSEKDYRLIPEKVQRSSFLSIQRPTDLSFSDREATVYLDLAEDASSTFQGVLGLQQAQAGKTTAVGSIELDIQNLFRSGKQLTFSWERFSEESQRLDLFYKHPFFLDSRLAPSFRFDLLKQDTTFLTRRVGMGVHTYIAPRSELFLEYERTVGTLLTTDLETISESGIADFSRNVYQARVTRGVRNSLNQLRQGLVWSTSISAGRKEVDRNLSIPDAYYDTIQAQSNFYRFEADITYQLKALKRQAFFHQVSGGILENDELLRNELYRIGGLSSLRGFNEKSFFARNFLMSRMEFRSFFESRSYAYVFYDQLIYDRENFSDQPFGLGLGFALATSAGQFSFALAMGKSKDQEISFSTMKAHFGYISRF
ncbi:MAG: ShlB/FhaC/HecB family hemolysin secretion/activation protein [Ekhidna sp.]|uniref:ShlB/FhaC/HecB family hemolysin secretion/activation protein n=1 Tax=Ekhidna sp. TaxID=2608089 RepID=UPI0032EB967E